MTSPHRGEVPQADGSALAVLDSMLSLGFKILSFLATAFLFKLYFATEHSINSFMVFDKVFTLRNSSAQSMITIQATRTKFHIYKNSVFVPNLSNEFPKIFFPIVITKKAKNIS